MNNYENVLSAMTGPELKSAIYQGLDELSNGHLIDRELRIIANGVYGEDVRKAIYDAFIKVSSNSDSKNLKLVGIPTITLTKGIKSKMIATIQIVTPSE